ncbi:hypothetical protein QVD17_42154 [Tagetes erecta]|uniref:Uncharacterized protein n=1 Tax=Tagetes erecta TaxID=13708 RepID=A0AAD8JN37_TARER|nr:hypothetical protein QVD17_42154 [Tagetes erecta]
MRLCLRTRTAGISRERSSFEVVRVCVVVAEKERAKEKRVCSKQVRTEAAVVLLDVVHAEREKIWAMGLGCQILNGLSIKKMAYAELFKSFESDDLTMAQSRFDNFAVLKNEMMLEFLDRFVMVANNLKKHDPDLGNHERVKRLLDSLPPEWSSHGKLMRRERGFTDYKLVEVMNKLKEMELDIKRREYDEAMSLNSKITSISKEKPEEISVSTSNFKELNDKACDATKEEEQKTNIRVCNCEKALASEQIIMELPYETVQDMCSSDCRTRLFGISEANKLLIENEKYLTQVNKELKLNESKYFVKLREALKENEHLKTNLLKSNVEVNMLTERVALAEFETSKLQTKLEKWTISGMKLEDLIKSQRGARIKTGLGHEDKAFVYPPPSTYCYSPTPTPHPTNELIHEIIQKDTDSLYAGLKNVNLKEVRDDYESPTGIGYSKLDVVSQTNDCSVSSVSKSVQSVSSNFFDKFKAGEIPTFEPVLIAKEEIKSDSRNHQAINQDPLEAEVLIEDWTSSDDESKTKESLGDSKIKMSSATVKSEMLPKPESSQIRISFPAARQVSRPSKAQKKKSSPLSIISQVCKRLENKQVKISSPIQQSKTKIKQPPTTRQKRPKASQQVASSSKKTPPPTAPHEPIKHQKPFKACFKCGKGDRVLKKCPKGHASDGKGKQVCFSGSVSRKNPPRGKSKQIFAANDGRSSVEQSILPENLFLKVCRRYRARNPPPTSSEALKKRLLESRSRFYERKHKKWGSIQNGGDCEIKIFSNIIWQA